MSDFMSFDNSGNSSSGVSNPLCGNYAGMDIWFSVTAPSSGSLFIATKEGTMIDAAMALYELPCSSPTELICIPNDLCGNTEMPIYTFDNLTPGQDYLIRIWAENGTPNGDFTLFANENPILVPDFILNGNATYINDECIRLTASTTGQIGCIWFPELIDFTQGFTHSMTMNFGTSDSGADGICLAYQSLGTWFCGGSGENIGAGGMTNSFIVEFDTYQNGNQGDPAQDHTGIGINGVLNHNTNPFPAMVLNPTNVENGNDYIVDFVWDPSMNYFEVYFDGTLYNSGVYDIINNCFNGNNMAYWGYTSSTGGAFNNQTVCPGVETFEHGEYASQEVTICDNETFFAGGALQNTTGVYYDQTPIANGCYQLMQTTLNVLPSFMTDLGSIHLCTGETFEVGGIDYQAIGNYNVVLPSIQNGCDSIIQFDINLIAPVAIASVNDELDCDTPFVVISGIGSFPPPFFAPVYQWTGPNGFTSNELNPMVNQSGEYILTLVQTINGVSCTSNESSVIVMETGDIPFANAGESSTLDCTIINAVLDGSSSDPNLEYLWIGPDGFMSKDQVTNTMVSGTYFLTVTGDNGCTSTSQVIIYENYDTYIIDLYTFPLSCDTPETSIQNTNFDGTGQHLWTGPAIDQSNEFDGEVIINLPGIYTLQITGDNGCIGYDTIEVIQLPGDYEYSLESDTLTCGTTAINLESNPGGNYDIVAWSGPDNFIDSTANPIVETEGIYYFEITDINGCVGVDSIEVILNDTLPMIDFMIDSIQCTIEGAISLSANDNYNYQWNGPGSFMSNEQSINSGFAGEYQLEVTGLNGCVEEYLIELPATDDYPNYETSFNQIDCAATTSTINFSTTESIDNFQWSSPDGLMSTEETITTNEEGFFYLEVTGETGCVVYDTIQITIDTIPPTGELFSDTLTCLANSVILETNNLSDFNTNQWTGPNNFMTNDLNPIIEEAGDYTLTLIGDNSCETLLSVEVVERTSKPNLTPDFNHLDCDTPFSTISFMGDANLDFQWQGPNNFTSLADTEIVIQNGIYTINATNSYGCDTNIIIDILLDTISPSFSLIIPALDCNNPTANVSYSSNDNIVDHYWSGPNGFITNGDEISVDYSGDFYLTVESSNGCTRSQDFIILEDFVYPTLMTEKSNDIDCNNQSSTLTSSYDVVNPNINWLDDNNNNSLGTEEILIVENSGNYILEIFGDNGCTSLDTIQVFIDTITPPLSVNYNDINCSESTAFINVIDPDGNLNYTFSSNNEILAESNSYSTEESIALTILAQASNGCITEENIMIEIDTISPLVNPETTLINCFNPEALLSVDEANNYSYDWSFDEVTVSNNANFSTPQSGNYTIEIQNQTNGCNNSAIINVADYTPLGFEFNVDPLNCEDAFGAIQIDNIIGGNEAYEVSINNGQDFSSSTDFINLAPANYQIIVQDADGCQAFAEWTLEDLTPVDIEVETELTINLGDEVNIEVILNLLENELSLIEWTLDTDLIDCTNCLNPQVIGYDDGQLQLLVVDQNGCEDIATISIRFNKIVNIYVPNVFSPFRKDGNNDYFFPFAKAQQVKQIDELLIFDRWGEQVFEQYDFPPNESEHGWNGTFRDKSLNPGVFAYYLKYTLIDGEEFKIVGDVTIVD